MRISLTVYMKVSAAVKYSTEHFRRHCYIQLDASRKLTCMTSGVIRQRPCDIVSSEEGREGVFFLL